MKKENLLILISSLAISCSSSNSINISNNESIKEEKEIIVDSNLISDDCFSYVEGYNGSSLYHLKNRAINDFEIAKAYLYDIKLATKIEDEKESTYLDFNLGDKYSYLSLTTDLEIFPRDVNYYYIENKIEIYENDINNIIDSYNLKDLVFNYFQYSGFSAHFVNIYKETDNYALEIIYTNGLIQTYYISYAYILLYKTPYRRLKAQQENNLSIIENLLFNSINNK